MDSIQLFEILKCEFCSTHFQGTIFMCCQGHSLCENCSRKTGNCEICKNQLKYKNAAVMNIIENFRFTCDNCDSIFILKDFITHRKYSWTCYICDQNCISVENSLVHLKDEHKLKKIPYKTDGKIKVTQKEITVYCSIRDYFIVFFHKKFAKNVTVFTTSSSSVQICYTIGGSCKIAEIPNCRSIILLSPKELGLNYLLEFEILKF